MLLPTFKVLTARVLHSIIHVHGGTVGNKNATDSVRSGVAIVSGYICLATMHPLHTYSMH